MTPRPLVSIIINNYNYERFVADAIGSSLNQTYSQVEVIVVDDGSTDKSREVIDQYQDRIERIHKPNGGQGSAMNAGFQRSQGDLVLFLDADDILEKDVIEEVVRRWDGRAPKLHYRMNVIDGSGKVIGQNPAQNLDLPEGDIRRKLIRHGHYITPPASGNVYSRKFLEATFPLPEEKFRSSADAYPYLLAPFYGEILALPRIGACYRMHGNNGFLKRRRLSTVRDLQGTLERAERCLALLKKVVQEKGLEWTYSPKYYPDPHFTRLLLLRAEGKADLRTVIYLCGNITYGVWIDSALNARQRLAWLLKTALVALAPMFLLKRFYPHLLPNPTPD